MAVVNHPWRDIVSDAAWKSISSQTNTTDSKKQTLLSDLTRQITEYHRVDKRDRAKFDDRIQKLAAIENVAIDILKFSGTFDQMHVDKSKSELKRDSQTSGSDLVKPKSSEKYEVDRYNQKGRAVPKNAKKKLVFASDSIDPWLRSLARRAAKKRDYLNCLKNHYASTKPDASPADFIDYLKQQLKEYQQIKGQSKPLPMYPGVHLEKIDPYHRPVELKLEEQNQTLDVKDAGNRPMSAAVVKWISSGSSAPFFIWLEGDDICTTSPFVDSAFKETYKSEVNRVAYQSSAEYPIHHVKALGSQLYHRNVDDQSGQYLPLNSRQFSSAKMIGGAMYVWVGGNNLYTAEHVSGHAHHSSLAAGAAVQCAGMWEVQNGKVTKLNDNSGHYKPGSFRLKRFVAHLSSLTVLAHNVEIQTYVPGKGFVELK
jgi:hypothetical protein